jgi:hypothetical protein
MFSNDETILSKIKGKNLELLEKKKPETKKTKLKKKKKSNERPNFKI